jgi:hypothetical protein
MTGSERTEGFRKAIRSISRRLSRSFGSLTSLPRYFQDRHEFKRRGGSIALLHPILKDYSDQAGSTQNAYFHQDLLVASFIFKANPRRHIDVGSRIDGFVAHVAAFREIEVLDVRQLEDTGHPNIRFLQADLMRGDLTLPTADCVSCLHAIEHFGLGRYGDAIDPEGHLKGFANVVEMVAPGGTLYISFPIGRRTEVQFNAQRVFHPQAIFDWQGCAQLHLERFDFVDDDGTLHQNLDIAEICRDPRSGCGIYTFGRLAASSTTAPS